MSDLFSTDEKARGLIDSLEIGGVAVDDWGSLTIADDVTAEDLARIVRVLYRSTNRAQSLATDYANTVEYVRGQGTQTATIFGQMAKAAAIDQRWCNEYEEWTEKIGQALAAHGLYAESTTFKAEAERREKYTVQVTVLANNSNSAYDWRYALENEFGTRHGVTVAEFGDVTRVLPTADEDPNGEDVTY